MAGVQATVASVVAGVPLSGLCAGNPLTDYSSGNTITGCLLGRLLPTLDGKASLRSASGGRRGASAVLLLWQAANDQAIRRSARDAPK